MTGHLTAQNVTLSYIFEMIYRRISGPNSVSVTDCAAASASLFGLFATKVRRSFGHRPFSSGQ
jgi:hypothetical protein